MPEKIISVEEETIKVYKHINETIILIKKGHSQKALDKLDELKSMVADLLSKEKLSEREMHTLEVKEKTLEAKTGEDRIKNAESYMDKLKKSLIESNPKLFK